MSDLATDNQFEDQGIFDIDENELDKAWLDQPRLFFHYAKELADTKLNLAEADSKVTLVKASLNQDMRENPEEYSLGKVTDKSIEAAVLARPELRKAVNRVNHLKHQVDILQAVVSALEHRKRALENLVTLHGQNYFSVPTIKDVATREKLADSRKERIRKKGHNSET